MMKEKEWDINGLRVLEKREPAPEKIPAFFGEESAADVRSIHSQIGGYSKTPLISLPGLAESLGVGSVFVKDESGRFGLKAFKGLGGSYAMFRVICGELGLDPKSTSLDDLTGGKYRDRISRMEFVTCTDGNHGKGVSWAAGLFGCTGRWMTSPRRSGRCATRRSPL